MHFAPADAEDLNAPLETLAKRLDGDGGFRRVALALIHQKDCVNDGPRHSLRERPNPLPLHLLRIVQPGPPFFQHEMKSAEPLFIEDVTTLLCAPLNPAFLQVRKGGWAIFAPLRARTRPVGMILHDGWPFLT